MNKTLIGILGVAIGVVAWQTSEQWLPQAKAFLQNEVAPPSFKRIKDLFFNKGRVNFTAVLSFDNKTPIPINITNLRAKVFRLVSGNWVLIGETRPEDQKKISIGAKQKGDFDIDLQVPLASALDNVVNTVFNFRKDQFRAEIEGRTGRGILNLPFSISHEFTDKQIGEGLFRIAA